MPDHPTINGQKAPATLPARFPRPRKCASHLGFSPNPPMDGARTAEGGEGVTSAMVRAQIRVDGRLKGDLQALLGRRWRPTEAVVSEMAG